MSRTVQQGWKLLAALAVALALAPSGLRAQLSDVINEDFETGMPAGVGIVTNAAGNVDVIDDGSGENNVLSLTQGLGSQGGWVWFPDQFDLASKRVEIEFDLFIGHADTRTPADGVSVIFQFDGDLEAIGDAGGGLGVGNLRGTQPHDYISVGFDIWDNGGVDGEYPPIEGRYGGDGATTAHVELDQNIDPENVPSQVEAASPDYIASAAVYGSPDTALNNGFESYDPADLIHVTIIFDNGLVDVTMQGGVMGTSGDLGAGFDPGEPFNNGDPKVVISHALQQFPDRLSNIGFAASTGGRVAWQWIDNLQVREGPSAVVFETEPLLSDGAMNCAGPAIDATAEINADFRAEGDFGGELSRTGDIQTGITITANRFGRMPSGANNNAANNRPIDVSGIQGAGAETATALQTIAWSTDKVQYRAGVVPGRYEVDLYWAENFGGAVSGTGQCTRIVDVLLGDEKVLGNWCGASAAGSADGSGDPSAICSAVLDVGLKRTFTVDVADGGDGSGTLDVIVDDLGGGNPPENAALNALAFRRTGDTTGQPAGGDVEIITGPETTPPAGNLIEEDFEGVADGECPAGMVCNTNAWQPQGLAGQLKIIDDATGSTGATAIFEQTVNVRDHSLSAQFDLFFDNPDGAGDPNAAGFEAADGATFFVMQGSNTAALGPAGGSLGIPTGNIGFAVEFDTWMGGGNNEPSGFNSAEDWTHVGINNMSTDSTITNVQFDPNLKPTAFGGTGWPNFFDPDGVHVSIEYDGGHVTVTLEGLTADFEDFGPTVVAEADVFPIVLPEAVVGFSGGTGGRTHDGLIDNVEVAAEPGVAGEDPLDVLVDQARDRWNGSKGELYINSGGPMLACSASQFPAPTASGDPDTGESVVWIADLAGGGAQTAAANEFFSIEPLPNTDGVTVTGLEVATTNMGLWDARGTEPGVDDNDRIFHTERWADQQYEIPVENGDYEVTLYFANSYSGTAGTARRFYHIDFEGLREEGFEHCELINGGFLGGQNPLFGVDTLFDPVDAAEQLYSPSPCEVDGTSVCENNGVTVTDDPDNDVIQAPEECGNAAAVAHRVEVTVEDGSLTIALTEPDTAIGEPASPDDSPKISGIAVKRIGGGGPVFRRGDADASGALNITDGIFVLNFLFLGGPDPTCKDAADADDSGTLNITDGIFILNFLFLGGPDPSAPGPRDCGLDPTTGDLADCGAYAASCQ